ncbi:terminase small subunit-like protein [Phenylobacterium soli]|nr:hypothetical protein [Phenylobacterium soli]
MSKRTKQLEQQILGRLSLGEPLTSICQDVGIHYTTWREWCRGDQTLEIAHARARDLGFDAIAERARLTARGKGEGEGGDSSGDTQRDKLIIETDLKLLAKWDPRRYGDKITAEHTGPDGGPIRSETRLDVSALTDEQLRALASIPAHRG